MTKYICTVNINITSKHDLLHCIIIPILACHTQIIYIHIANAALSCMTVQH